MDWAFLFPYFITLGFCSPFYDILLLFFESDTSVVASHLILFYHSALGLFVCGRKGGIFHNPFFFGKFFFGRFLFFLFCSSDVFLPSYSSCHSPNSPGCFVNLNSIIVRIIGAVHNLVNLFFGWSLLLSLAKVIAM